MVGLQPFQSINQSIQNSVKGASKSHVQPEENLVDSAEQARCHSGRRKLPGGKRPRADPDHRRKARKRERVCEREREKRRDRLRHSSGSIICFLFLFVCLLVFFVVLKCCPTAEQTGELVVLPKLSVALFFLLELKWLESSFQLSEKVLSCGPVTCSGTLTSSTLLTREDPGGRSLLLPPQGMYLTVS